MSGRPCTCEHVTGRPWTAGQCRPCWLYRYDARYRALWDGLPAPEGPRATGPVVGGGRRYRPPCVHLGRPTGEPALCHSQGTAVPHQCRLHGVCIPDTVWHPERCCPVCPDHRPKVPDPIFHGEPGDIPCGVVIGTYGPWVPELVRLAVAQVRHTAGLVPVLVADDCSPRQRELEDACLDLGVDYYPNPVRIGHTGGDLSAFAKGIFWAAGRGLKVLAKLSQRFVPLRARWLQDGARDLALSGLPLAGRHCEGHENFPLRTEAVLLDVAAWQPLLPLLSPHRYPDQIAEHYLHGLLAERLGGVYLPWLYVGTDRYRRDAGSLWHCSHSAEKYHRLAALWNITLPADFSCEGWHGCQDYSRG